LSGRLAESSVDELHVYHPQPYYSPQEASRRLITPAFLSRAREVLKPGGLLILQTDSQAYWRYLRAAVPFHFEPELHRDPWPDAPRGRTRREILARKKGLAVWRMVAKRLETPRPGSPPEPVFDANRPRFRGRRV
ncbi:MAG: tRNA (guanine-N7)-methyltransferase, partial [Thermodesulfobacteriota bacterium]